MNTAVSEFVAQLAAKDVRLRAENGRLQVDSPDGAMTVELREELAARKAELLSYLDAPSKAVSAADDSPAGNVPIDRAFAFPTAWVAARLPGEPGLIKIPDACTAEVEATAAALRVNSAELTSLGPADFAMPECRALMSRVRTELDDGLGFVILDRLDIDGLGVDIARRIYWLLAAMVGRPVAQRQDGAMHFDVTDLGKRSMRAVSTRDEMNYHTDNSFNVAPPHYVGLLCIQTAKSGGISEIVSLTAAHDLLRERRPDLLERCYRPYMFDRQREHDPSEPKFIRKPIFENHDGRLAGRISRFHIRIGHALSGVPLDAEGEEAMEALETILNEPGMAQEFRFEQGQIQIIDNRRLGHKRTGFEDWDSPDRKRRLMRLWLRDTGLTVYNG